MNYILKDVQPEKHFASACCSFQLFEKCLIEEATELCASTTGPSTAIYIRDVVKDGVADFMDLACSRTRSITECRTNNADITKIFEAQLAKGVPPQNSSALYPFLQIATKFDY